jgi:hypothetical protein
VQLFPAVVQAGLFAIDAHFWFVQMPVQHCDGAEHAAPIDAQRFAPHVVPLHVPVQQSDPTAHEPPGPLHVLIEEPHLCVLESQSFEQQSVLYVHVAPVTPQTTPASPVYVEPSVAEPGPPSLPVAPSVEDEEPVSCAPVVPSVPVPGASEVFDVVPS